MVGKDGKLGRREEACHHEIRFGILGGTLFPHFHAGAERSGGPVMSVCDIGVWNVLKCGGDFSGSDGTPNGMADSVRACKVVEWIDGRFFFDEAFDCFSVLVAEEDLSGLRTQG